MGRLEIRRSEYAGACYGVQRALDLTTKAAKTEPSVCTLGPLIHNPRVVSELETCGVHVAQDVDAVDTASVVIRSHGVVPQVIDTLHELGVHVIDATCPHVMRAQRAAARLASLGKTVIVVGEAGHSEVEGISAHARAAGGTCIIVGSAEDIPNTIADPIGIVVQTTQSRALLDSVVDALVARGLHPDVKDTICFATSQRQDSARELAETVDVMLVLGGRNSSNTTRLFELCRDNCVAAYHIEDAAEIDPAWFDGCTTVGVTAGASTPESQIDAVITFLESL